MNVIQPFKKRIVIEALIFALAIALFVGLLGSLGATLIFRFVICDLSVVPVCIIVGVGLLLSVITGIIIYKKRYRTNNQKIARRIDSLGLDERVTTMIEYQKDQSYVAKVQRQDTLDRLSKVNVKTLRIRIPKKTIISCIAMFLVILMLLTILPAPVSAMEREEIECEQRLEEIR